MNMFGLLELKLRRWVRVQVQTRVLIVAVSPDHPVVDLEVLRRVDLEVLRRVDLAPAQAVANQEVLLLEVKVDHQAKHLVADHQVVKVDHQVVVSLDHQVSRLVVVDQASLDHQVSRLVEVDQASLDHQVVSRLVEVDQASLDQVVSPLVEVDQANLDQVVSPLVEVDQVRHLVEVAVHRIVRSVAQLNFLPQLLKTFPYQLLLSLQPWIRLVAPLLPQFHHLRLHLRFLVTLTSILAAK